MRKSKLLIASSKGDHKKVKLLLADPRVDPSANGNEAIIEASMEGHHEVVKLLLADPRVDPSADGNRSIRDASAEGYHEVVKLLLADPRVDPSADGNESIINASSGSHEVVKLLLADPRVDPSVDDNRAIRLASLGGYDEVVKLLLADPRVDPSDNDNEAIRKASSRGHYEAVKLLLADSRVDPSANGNEGIREIISDSNPFKRDKNYIKTMKMLLADPRVQNSITYDIKHQINKLVPGTFKNLLKEIIKDKLVPMLYNYSSKSQKICDVFKPLDKSELRFVAEIYGIDESLTRVQVCNQLGEILAKYTENKKLNVLKCNNEETSIGGDKVSDIPARKFFTYEQDTKVYCEDLEEFHEYIKGSDKNPFTGVKLRDDVIKRVKDEFKKFSDDKLGKYTEDNTLLSYYANLANLTNRLHYPRDDSWFKKLSIQDLIHLVEIVPGIQRVTKSNVIEEQRVSSLKDLVNFIEDDNVQPDKETKKILISQIWNGEN